MTELVDAADGGKEENDDIVIDFDEDEEEGDKIDVVDDTPEEDKGRTPLPKELVDELDNDELEEYSEKVKQRLKQYKKLAHDERREKERVFRENQESINTARRLLEDNKRLKTTLSEGEKVFLETMKRAAELELEVAKRSFREAQEMGDTDKITEAQEKLSQAVYKSQEAGSFRPTLQEENNVVEQQQQSFQAPEPDAKTKEWQKHNTWFGADTEMTATALGLHQALVVERGPQFAGTDDYWNAIDATMRKRFPERFEEDEVEAAKPAKKKATVVAPATRSRSPKKITLSKSQVAVAKKLGISPEEYAKELLKLEN